MFRIKITTDAELINKFTSKLTDLIKKLQDLHAQNLKIDAVHLLDYQFHPMERPMFSLDENPAPFFVKKIKGTELKVHFRPTKKFEDLSTEERETSQEFQQHYKTVAEAIQNFMDCTEELRAYEEDFLCKLLRSEKPYSSFFYVINLTILHNDLWKTAENLLENWLPLLLKALTYKEELALVSYFQYRLALLVQKANKKPLQALMKKNEDYLQNPLINAYRTLLELHKTKLQKKPFSWDFEAKFAFYKHPPLVFSSTVADDLRQTIQGEFACLACLLVENCAENEVPVFGLLNQMSEKNYVSQRLFNPPIKTADDFKRTIIYLEDALYQTMLFSMFFHSNAFLISQCLPKFEYRIIHLLPSLIETQSCPPGYLFFAPFTALNVLERLEAKPENLAKAQNLVRNTLLILVALKVLRSIEDYLKENPHVDELLKRPFLSAEDLQAKLGQLLKDLSQRLFPKEALFAPDAINKAMEAHLQNCFKSLMHEAKPEGPQRPLELPEKLNQSSFGDREVLDRALFNFYYALNDFYYMSTGLGYDSFHLKKAPQCRDLSLESKRIARQAEAFNLLITKTLPFILSSNGSALRNYMFSAPLGPGPIYYLLRSTILFEYPISIKQFYALFYNEKLGKTYHDASYKNPDVSPEERMVPLFSQIAAIFRGANLSHWDAKVLEFLEMQPKIQDLVYQNLSFLYSFKLYQKNVLTASDPKKYNYLIEAYIIFNELYETAPDASEKWNQDKLQKMELLAKFYPLPKEIPEIFLSVLRIWFAGDMLPKYLHAKPENFEKLSDIINQLCASGYFPIGMQTAAPSTKGFFISIAKLLEHVKNFNETHHVTSKQFANVLSSLKTLKLVVFNQIPIKLSSFSINKVQFIKDSIEILKANECPEHAQSRQNFFQGFQKLVTQGTKTALFVQALGAELPFLLRTFIQNNFLKEASQILNDLMGSTTTDPEIKNKYRPILRIIDFLALEISEEKPLDDAIHELIDAVQRTTKAALTAIDLSQELSMRLGKKIENFKDKYQILKHRTKIKAFASFSHHIITLAQLLDTEEAALNTIQKNLHFIKTTLQAEQPLPKASNEAVAPLETKAAGTQVREAKDIDTSLKTSARGLFSETQKPKKKNKASSQKPSPAPKTDGENPKLLNSPSQAPIAKQINISKKQTHKVLDAVALATVQVPIAGVEKKETESKLLEEKKSIGSHKPSDATSTLHASFSLASLQRMPLKEENIKLPMTLLIYKILDCTSGTLVLYRFSAINWYLNLEKKLPFEFILFTENLGLLYRDITKEGKAQGRWNGISEVNFEKSQENQALHFKFQFNDETFIIKIRSEKPLAKESVEEAMFKIISKASSNLNAFFVPFSLNQLTKQKKWQNLAIIGPKDCFDSIRKGIISVVNHKCLLTRTIRPPQALPFTELDQLFNKNHGFVFDAQNAMYYVNYRGDTYQITQIDVLNSHYLHHLLVPQGQALYASSKQLKKIRLAGGHAVASAMLVRVSQSPNDLPIAQIIALLGAGNAYLCFEEKLYYGYFSPETCSYEFDEYPTSSPHLLNALFPEKPDFSVPASSKQLQALTYLSGPAITIPPEINGENFLQALEDLIVGLLHYETFEFEDTMAKMLEAFHWKELLNASLQDMDNRKTFAYALNQWFAACTPEQVQNKLAPLLGKLGIIEGMTGLNYAFIERAFPNFARFARESSMSPKVLFDSCIVIHYCMQNPQAKRGNILAWPYYYCIKGHHVGQILYSLLRLGFWKDALHPSLQYLIVSIREHYMDPFQQKLAQKFQWQQQQNLAYNFECLRAKVYQNRRYAMFQPEPQGIAVKPSAPGLVLR